MARTFTQADALTVRARRTLSDHRTRAKKDGAILGYTLANIRQLLESSQCCEYCKMPLAWDVQLDHRTPLSRGGRHVLENLAACCSRCNSAKGMLCELEYRQLRTLLEALHPVARGDIERRLLAGAKRYSGSRKKGTVRDFLE